MTDIVLEVARAIIMGMIFAYLLWVGRKENLRRHEGWSYILLGFGLILLGGIVDITDNFETLNGFVIIGDTEYEAWLEKVGGYLLGFSLLAIGFSKWMPYVAARWRAEGALQEANLKLDDANRTLEERVEQRTDALAEANLKLEEANQTLEQRVQQLVETQAQLLWSEKLAAIGQLAGGMAHDLRNPLGVIRNAVYYLKRRLCASEVAQSDPETVTFLQIIEERVKHSNVIISDLMTFARAATPIFSPSNIDVILESCLAGVELREDVHIVKQIDPDLVEVSADSDQLRRVFVNLATNAQDAMPNGGNLTISARRMDRVVEVTFADNGVGIPADDIEKVFEPLFTTKTRGTGLGLAICQQIISKHGGSIEVMSKSSEGTAFTVRLPINGVEGSENGE